MVGSMLFVVGCAADLLEVVSSQDLSYVQKRDAIDWPFLVGSRCGH